MKIKRFLHHRCRTFFAATLCLVPLSTPVLRSQTGEVRTKDAPVIFKSTSNLIPVPVVVRDSSGRAIGSLGLGDFQLFDNGKPQTISKFSVETPESAAGTGSQVLPQPEQQKSAPPSATPSAAAASEAVPERFVAYLFDDLHMSLADLVYTRDAARRQIDSPNHARERTAIYTTSGREMQEFTGDRDKLHAALAAIASGPASASKAMEQSSCPPLSFYMSDMIQNKNDKTALNIAAIDAAYCANLNLGPIPKEGPSACYGPDAPRYEAYCMAVQMATRAASQAVTIGDRDAEATLSSLRAIVSRMTSMPGRRALILVSPGFLVPDDRHEEETGLIDRAIRAKVVIGGLDARGLYSQIPGGDASERGNTQALGAKVSYQNRETMVQSDIMADLADGTGGTFYHGTNDYDEGFARVAAAPQYLYVLGFSPQDLKLDGSFHTLKVTLKNGKGMNLQVRRGYYAASYAASPETQAAREIEEAFFSPDEVHDLPVILQTRYFKHDDGDATLTAVAKIDVRQISFRKEADRNRNDVTVIAGLFDSDGNFVTGVQKALEMRLLDQTLQTRLGSGLPVESNFIVHPGRYIVRIVVRESNGRQISAQSSIVEIP